jgi:hypothetical protein
MHRLDGLLVYEQKRVPPMSLTPGRAMSQGLRFFPS